MNQKVSSYRWIILLLTFLPCLWTSFCQFQTSAVGGELMTKLNINMVQFSTVMLAPMLVGVFLSLIGGTMADKYGVKKVILISLILSSAGAVFRTWTDSYPVLFVLMLCLGMAGAMINADMAKLLMEWFPPKEMGLAVGIVVAAGSAGTAIAQATTAFFPSMTTAFIFGGVVMVVLTVLWLLFVKERKMDDRDTAAGEHAPAAKMSDVFKSRNIWLVAVGTMLHMGANMTVSSFLITGLTEGEGVSAVTAGVMASLFTFGSLAGSILIPSVITRMRNSKILCAVLSLAAAATLYLAWTSGSAGLKSVLLVVSGFCLGGMLPTFMSFPALLPEIGPAKAGVAGGLVGTLMMAGAFLIPSYVIAPIAGNNFTLMFLMAAVCEVCMAVIFLLLPSAGAIAAEK